MKNLATPIVIFILFISCQFHSFKETDFHKAFILGTNVDTLLPVLESSSDSIKQFRYSGEVAAPFTTQTQIDCYGFEVFGKKRKVEFLFNDGPLGHIWLLIEKEEIELMTQELEKYCGEIVHEQDGKKVFRSGTVAIQNNPPEILIATPEIITAIMGYSPKR